MVGQPLTVGQTLKAASGSPNVFLKENKNYTQKLSQKWQKIYL